MTRRIWPNIYSCFSTHTHTRRALAWGVSQRACLLPDGRLRCTFPDLFRPLGEFPARTSRGPSVPRPGSGLSGRLRVGRLRGTSLASFALGTMANAKHAGA